MNFGTTPDGAAVTRHQIAGGGLTAHILSYGAILQDLRLEGHAPPLVLGFDNFPPYLTDSPYFGAIVGRCANRIGQGRFQIDGVTYQLDRNVNDTHSLHGGVFGVGRRNWQVENVDADRVTLRIDLADGEMGYPGNMTARATYACLPDGVLDLTITAETDAPTLCNFAHHSYWNLDGGPDPRHHSLQLDAAHMTAVDQDFIPTGALTDVTGTRYDFRTMRPVADKVFIDHNLCLSPERAALRRVGRLASAKSGIAMDLLTTEPGMQVYDGYKIKTTNPGLAGQRYAANAGIALEPQIWPDAVNHDTFPNAVLRPGETYRQQSQFAFQSTG